MWTRSRTQPQPNPELQMSCICLHFDRPTHPLMHLPVALDALHFLRNGMPLTARLSSSPVPGPCHPSHTRLCHRSLPHRIPWCHRCLLVHEGPWCSGSAAGMGVRGCGMGAMLNVSCCFAIPGTSLEAMVSGFQLVSTVPVTFDWGNLKITL